MKQSLLIASIILSSCVVSAQQLNWLFTIGDTAGSSFAKTHDIAEDSQGNIIVTGEFRGTLDFDPGSGTNMFYNLNSSTIPFVAKYASTGAYLWAFTINSSFGYQQYAHIAVDANDDILFTCPLSGSAVDVDPGIGTYSLSSSGGHDILLSKYSNAGNFLWAKSWGGGYSDWAYDVAVDNASNIVITGGFRSAFVVLEPGDTLLNSASNNSDFFLIRCDDTGNVLWSHCAGNIYNDNGRSITCDSDGNIFVSGEYGSNGVDLDFGVASNYLPYSGGGADAFLAKYDSSGTHLWSFGIGEAGTGDYFWSIAVDAVGDCYVTGSFGNTLDVDPTANVANLIGSTSSMSTLFIKYSSAGNLVFGHYLCDGGGDCVSISPGGNVVVSGYLFGTHDFDPGSGTAQFSALGNLDMFLMKYDINGAYVGGFTCGSPGGSTEALASLETIGNRIYAVGLVFGNNVDFAPGSATALVMSNTSTDAFVVAYDGFVSVEDRSLNKMVSGFPNPAGDFIEFYFDQITACSMDISIYNAAGEIVHVGKNQNGNSYSVQTKDWKPGIYFMKSESAEGIYTSTFLVE